MSIYEQHDKAFAKVSAYVVTKAGQRVAAIAVKYPQDGAGRVWAYVHWIGTAMVRGKADGYGYDKRSAAIAAAAYQMKPETYGQPLAPNEMGDWSAFGAALRAGGEDAQWARYLEAAGFTVMQAI
jgi:hypothetical protein